MERPLELPTQFSYELLFAAMLIGHHVADDAGRGFELVKLFPGIRAHRFQVTFERAVEDNVTGGCQSARPDRWPGSYKSSYRRSNRFRG